MAGIRVCLPGKHTAVMSVTPLKIKHPVGHADHSKEAATTVVTELEAHAARYACYKLIQCSYMHLVHVSYNCS